MTTVSTFADALFPMRTETSSASEIGYRPTAKASAVSPTSAPTASRYESAREFTWASFSKHARFAQECVELRSRRLAVVEESMELDRLRAQVDVAEGLRVQELPGPPDAEQAILARGEVEPAEGQVRREIHAFFLHRLHRAPPRVAPDGLPEVRIGGEDYRGIPKQHLLERH